MKKTRKNLWSPWRLEYIQSVKETPSGCIFCTLPKQGAIAENLILLKGKKSFIILNRYPYTNGHLMVVPSRHLDDFGKLTPAEHQEMGDLISRSIAALKKEYNPQGFNVGLNIGLVAGAGIKDHLHYHIVPRWNGDSNFMPVLADVRMMPEHLLVTYQRLKKALQ